MVTVTDEEISQALQSLLHHQANSDPDFSFLDVVHRLQSRFGVDLTHKLDFIRSQIHLLRQSPPPPSKDHFALQHNPNLHASSSSSTTSLKTFSPQDAAVPVRQAPKESTETRVKRRGGPGGLNKLCGVSPELQTIVGQPALARTEIVKQLWAYIRKNNLQDPTNRRKIICNDELRVVFETDCTDMFKMNKLLAKHIIPLEPTKESASKKVKTGNPGTQSTPSGPSVTISEELASFLGVSVREMLQSEVLRRIWEYIKLNGLEDPVNSMVIICDAKLQQLFGCRSISALGIPQVLAGHHILPRS